MKNEGKWVDLSIKEKLAILTAVIAFAAGWILTGVAAFVPLFLSEQSVLFVLGQALIYSASVFGITGYFSSESQRMRRDLKRMMLDERMKLEEEIDKENDVP